MKKLNGTGLSEVKEVYDGPEGALWELIMGEQIHIGGFSSSMDLAQKSGIKPGSNGVDFCCCNGAGMRFLTRFCEVGSITGVDASETVVNSGIKRCEAEGLSDQISFILSDVCDTSLESDSFDFAWGEDAWCYVSDKEKLVSEAARVVKPGGIIAFTDWVEGENLSDEEAERLMKFMKFPVIYSIGDYRNSLEKSGLNVKLAENTGRFPEYMDLYLDMLNKQLTYDALKIIGFDMEMMQGLGGEMEFIRQLAKQNKIMQGLFVATKS
jgi:ubiquinone/menaquinone biosynthesis C-methylase UbiE